MTRAFGPVVEVDSRTKEVSRVHCNWCIFRCWHAQAHACSHADRKAPRLIPDPGITPDWCKMKADAIRDALDMARGVTHRVWRWSGRRTDAPRMIYEGIPSEAERQFRLAARDARRGTVRLCDASGAHIAVWPNSEDAA